LAITLNFQLFNIMEIIQSWHDRNITAGEDWKTAIDTNLESAGIILLLQLQQPYPLKPRSFIRMAGVAAIEKSLSRGC
jgi:hypothetical protein